MCNLSEGIVSEVTKDVTKKVKKNLTNEHALNLAKLVKEGTLTVLQAATVVNMTEKQFEVFLH